MCYRLAYLCEQCLSDLLKDTSVGWIPAAKGAQSEALQLKRSVRTHAAVCQNCPLSTLHTYSFTYLEIIHKLKAEETDAAVQRCVSDCDIAM